MSLVDACSDNAVRTSDICLVLAAVCCRGGNRPQRLQEIENAGASSCLSAKSALHCGHFVSAKVVDSISVGLGCSGSGLVVGLASGGSLCRWEGCASVRVCFPAGYISRGIFPRVDLIFSTCGPTSYVFGLMV